MESPQPKKKEESKEKLYELESPVKERAYFEILRYGRKEAQFLRTMKKNQMSQQESAD